MPSSFADADEAKELFDALSGCFWAFLQFVKGWTSQWLSVLEMALELGEGKERTVWNALSAAIDVEQVRLDQTRH